VSTTISPVICLPIHLPICLALHLAVLLPIHLPILLSVSLTVLLPIRLPILLSVSLAIRLPIGLAIFLSDIRLREYHIRQDGRCRHGHDYAGDHSGFQETVLHDVCSFYMREWVISERRGCCWMAPILLSQLVVHSNQLSLSETGE
jgi:hypothetical protein